MLLPAHWSGRSAPAAPAVTRRRLLTAASVASVLLALPAARAAGSADAAASGQAPATPTGPFDPRRFSGTRIRLLAGGHPWTRTILPQLGAFERLTGIVVEHEDVADGDLSGRLADADADVVLSAAGPSRPGGVDPGVGAYSTLDGLAGDGSLTAADVDRADLGVGSVRVPLRGQAGLTLRPGSAAGAPDERVRLARRLHDPGAGSSFLYSYGASRLAEDAFGRQGDLPRLYGPATARVEPGDVGLFQQGGLALLVHASAVQPGAGSQAAVVADVGPGEYAYGLSIAARSVRQGAAWYFIQWATRPAQNAALLGKAQYVAGLS